MLRVSLIAALGVFTALPQLPPAPFVPRMFARGGHRMPYRLFVPDATARRQPLPLVVWLHGANGVGSDNTAQISKGGNDVGSRLWVKPEIQAKFPAFVIAPQSPSDQLWGNAAAKGPTVYGQLVLDLIESLAQEFAIDRDRVYLLGQSRGGIGVWDLITKKPDVFAAAVPLCAQGDPKRAAAAARVRVWVFHGAQDSMPVDNARAMVAALHAAGGVVKYTEYPDLGHEIWSRVFAEPGLPAWLFAQRRQASECPGLCGAAGSPNK